MQARLNIDRFTISHSKEIPSIKTVWNDENTLNKLKKGFLFTFVYMLVEFIGGYFTHSLSLIADAGHMSADAAGIVLALISAWIHHTHLTTQQNPDNKASLNRVEMIATLFNGVALVIMSVWLVFEAINRINNPEPVLGGAMLIIAVGGLLVNIVVIKMFRNEDDLHKTNHNMRGAYLHVLGDLLGSVGAIFAALVVILFGWPWIDALVSVVIAGLILYNAGRLIKDSVWAMKQ